MNTIATLLSGGEGVGVGARAAGLRHLWGIELKNDVAGVARANGFNVITAAIQDVDPHTLEVPDILHASPECQRASNANNAAGDIEARETRIDLELAECIIRYLEILRPKVFTLENVYAYRKFQAYRKIELALARLGYFSDAQHLNAADFGVPQTRQRLILRAVRGGLVPMLPAPEPWVGWYTAIEDLISTLPESKFAPWQLERLDASLLKDMELEDQFFVGGGNKSQSFLDFAIENRKSIPAIRNGSQPMSTIPADTATVQAGRAFILSNAATEWGDGWRAWLVESKNANQKFGDGLRSADEPAPTVVTDHKASHQPKAWLSQGRVVKMTPRCLARFQSFPDEYVLPDSNRLACAVIGNAVPPKMYEKLARQLQAALPEPLDTLSER